jgi:nickel/cobalt transporter (NicO) family protein
MWQIFIGSLILSLIHASIPNHWLPLIAIGKAEKWTQKETLLATLITGFAHTLSTVLIGVIVGFIGYKLSNNYKFITEIITPSILILLGLIYIIIDLSKHNHHHHEHSHFKINNDKINRKSKLAVITSLSIAMFLTPCTELEVYYFQASTIGWIGILIVSVVYTFTTVILMLFLVHFGMKGINRFRSLYLEEHERSITGLVLVILGVIAYFVN